MIITILLSLGVGQPDTLALSLDAARARALEANPTLLAERAEARAAGTMTGTASRAFLPSVRAEVMGMRTNDPVAVFGLKLRQGVFAGSDLALDALNNPAAFGGFTSAAIVELPLIAPEGWFGYGAAGKGAAAREAAASRMAGGVGKSGCPTPRFTMSSPRASRSLTLTSTATVRDSAREASFADTDIGFMRGTSPGARAPPRGGRDRTRPRRGGQLP